MLTLRPADLGDMPPLAALLEAHKHKYLDDFSEFTPSDLPGMIASGELLVIDRYGYPVGVCRYSNQLEDLHVSIHLVINPHYLKQVLREKTLEAVIDAGFSLGVGKIKSYPMGFQKGAIKLLRMHGFRELDTLYKETKKDGIKTDIHPFELRKSHWLKRKQQHNDAKRYVSAVIKADSAGSIEYLESEQPEPTEGDDAAGWRHYVGAVTDGG